MNTKAARIKIIWTHPHTTRFRWPLTLSLRIKILFPANRIRNVYSTVQLLTNSTTDWPCANDKYCIKLQFSFICILAWLLLFINIHAVIYTVAYYVRFAFQYVGASQTLAQLATPESGWSQIQTAAKRDSMGNGLKLFTKWLLIKLKLFLAK